MPDVVTSVTFPGARWLVVDTLSVSTDRTSALQAIVYQMHSSVVLAPSAVDVCYSIRGTLYLVAGQWHATTKYCNHGMAHLDAGTTAYHFLTHWRFLQTPSSAAAC
eukprot:358639-Chlamydomonas_euryale.AAC.1